VLFMTIAAFLQHLQTYHGELVFNPWADYDPQADIGPQAPLIRAANFKRYLELRTGAHYLFIAEGLGYQGGHFSGMAMTSERILLGHHPQIRPEEVLGEWPYQRTSNPDSPLLKATQKKLGFNEPTATVMWETLHRHGLAVFDAVLWNIFPFHPYKKTGILTNRTPEKTELDAGIVYARELLALLPQARVIAIGQKAATTLDRYGIPNSQVPHPSMGGANRFKAAAAELFGGARD
jgi:hypothetical protein